MAKTKIQELIIRLKGELGGAKDAAEALRGVERAADSLAKAGSRDAAKLNVLAGALGRSEKAAKEFAASAGKPIRWGAGFQAQLDRLRVAPSEFEKVRASWERLQADIKGKDKAFQTSTIRRWRNEAISDIAAVRAATEELGKAEERSAVDAARAAERAAREKAAVQKAAARSTAAEVARLTRETAQAERAASAEAKRLAREEARAKTAGAREAARAAREASQEQARAARASAREQMRAAREAAAVAKAEAREQARVAREASAATARAAREQARSTRQTFRGISRELGMMFGIGAGGYMVGRATRYTAVEGAEAEREKSRDYLAGLSAEDTARIGAASISASDKTPSVAAVTLHSLIREGANTALGLDNSIKLAPELAKAVAVIQSLKGTDVALTSMERFVRGLDTLGKNTDPEQITRLLNGIVKATGVQGLEFSPGDVFTVAKRAKSGGANLSEDFLTQVLPPLVADLGADQVGTALGSMVSQIIGNRGTKKSVAAQWDVGMRDENGVKNAGILLADPYKWTQETLIPSLQQKGFDVNDDEEMIRVTSAMFSNQRVADLFARMIIQRSQYDQIIAKEKNAPGLEAADEISKRDPFVAMQGMIAQTQNLVAALTGPLMPTAIEMMNNFSSGIGSLAQTLNAHPDLAKLLGGLAVGITALAAAVVVAGSALAVAGAAKNGALALGLAGGAAAAGGGSGKLGRLGKLGSWGLLLAGGIELGDEIPHPAWMDQTPGELWGKMFPSSPPSTPPNLGATGRATAAIDPATWERSRRATDEWRSDPEGTLGRIMMDFNARQVAAEQGKAAGADLAAGVAQGVAANSAQVDAQAQTLMQRIRSFFTSGVNVPVRLSPSGGVGAPRSAPGIGSRASGGSVYAGGLYQINEYGDEFFSPAGDGTVVRPSSVGTKVHAAGGSRMNMKVDIHVSGTGDPDTVAAKVLASLQHEGERAMRALFSDYGLDTA